MKFDRTSPLSTPTSKMMAKMTVQAFPDLPKQFHIDTTTELVEKLRGAMAVEILEGSGRGLHSNDMNKVCMVVLPYFFTDLLIREDKICEYPLNFTQVWMDERKGLKIGSTYRNSKRAKEFIFYIVEAERKKLKEVLATTKFLSVMNDSSTDSAVMEEELVYVRWATAGKMEVPFVVIQTVDKPDASHIAEAISSLMETVSGSEDETGQWLQKLVACGTTFSGLQPT
ncbi:uncharacterized protein V6R79_015741 [Siganus canaliculatus]